MPKPKNEPLLVDIDSRSAVLLNAFHQRAAPLSSGRPAGFATMSQVPTSESRYGWEIIGRGLGGAGGGAGLVGASAARASATNTSEPSDTQRIERASRFMTVSEQRGMGLASYRERSRPRGEAARAEEDEPEARDRDEESATSPC